MTLSLSSDFEESLVYELNFFSQRKIDALCFTSNYDINDDNFAKFQEKNIFENFGSKSKNSLRSETPRFLSKNFETIFGGTGEQ